MFAIAPKRDALTASASCFASTREWVTYLWRELRLLVLLSLSTHTAENKGQKGPLKKQMRRARVRRPAFRADKLMELCTKLLEFPSPCLQNSATTAAATCVSDSLSNAAMCCVGQGLFLLWGHTHSHFLVFSCLPLMSSSH